MGEKKKQKKVKVVYDVDNKMSKKRKGGSSAGLGKGNILSMVIFHSLSC